MMVLSMRGIAVLLFCTYLYDLKRFISRTFYSLRHRIISKLFVNPGNQSFSSGIIVDFRWLLHHLVHGP